MVLVIVVTKLYIYCFSSIIMRPLKFKDIHVSVAVYYYMYRYYMYVCSVDLNMYSSVRDLYAVS